MDVNETIKCHGCRKRISEGHHMTMNVWFCEECHKRFWNKMDKKPTRTLEDCLAEVDNWRKGSPFYI